MFLSVLFLSCEDDFNLFRAFFLDFSLLSFKFFTLLFNAKSKIKVITGQFFVFKHLSALNQGSS